MSKKKMKLAVCCSVLAVVLAAGVCSAERISDPDQIKYWEYTYFQSMITYVSPLHDYIVTTDRKILLVDAEHEGGTLATSIRDVHGNDSALGNLRAGSWVYVWGGVLADHSIGARDIVLLPGKLTDLEWDQYPVLKERKKFISGHAFY